jgi:hypothetical protein
MILDCPRDELISHERIIAEGIVEVATELRMVDASELVALIRNNEQANISDIVSSSSELYFKAGALRYGLVADYELVWSSAPTVVLNMEFGHASVSAFFRLILTCSSAGIEVLDMLFGEADLSGETRNRRLVEAIAAAKLTR